MQENDDVNKDEEEKIMRLWGKEMFCFECLMTMSIITCVYEYEAWLVREKLQAKWQLFDMCVVLQKCVVHSLENLFDAGMSQLMFRKKRLEDYVVFSLSSASWNLPLLIVFS